MDRTKFGCTTYRRHKSSSFDTNTDIQFICHMGGESSRYESRGRGVRKRQRLFAAE